MGNNIICSSHLLKASSKHFESNLGISSPALIKSDIKKIYYLFKTPIGMGKYGVVRKANKIADPSRFFAVKTVHKTSKQIQAIYNEISILNSLDHPLIVKLYEVYETEEYIHLVMEYMEGGDLNTFFMENPNIDEMSIIKIMKQILIALNYLHHLGICHKDIKPENIMITKERTSGDFSIKIIDFGFAERFFEQKNGKKISKKMSLPTGTPIYMAPEILQRNLYTEKCDLWSLGILMFMLLTKKPFSLFNSSDVSNEEGISYSFNEMKITKNETLRKFPQATDLLKHLLKTNPTKRFSTKQALNHIWFQKYQEEVKEELKETIKNMLSEKRPSIAQNLIMKMNMRSLGWDKNPQLQKLFLFLDKKSIGKVGFYDMMFFERKYHNKSMKSKDILLEDTVLSYTEFLVFILQKELKGKCEEVICKLKNFSKIYNDADSTKIIESLHKMMEAEGFKGNEEDIMNLMREVCLEI